MKRKILLFLLTLLPMMASADDSGTCGDNLTWTYESVTSTLTISGTGCMYDYAIYNTAPWYSLRNSIKEVIINGGTYIGKYAFYNCSGLTSVTIPNIVTSIGQSAFYSCSGLTSVTLNSDAFVSYDLRDKDRSFKYYFGNEVKEYIIGNDVTSISRYAFYGCSGLTSVTISNSVTTIGNYAFYGCSGLTSVTIPNSVTSIGYQAFYNCSSLASVTIGNSVTSIDRDAFFKCSGLTSVTLNNDYIVSADRTSNYSINSIFGNQVKEYVIGDGVTSIGNYAFDNCYSLTSIAIPNSMTSIGDDAFWNCSGLTSVHISDLAAWCNISFSSYQSNPLYYAHHLYLNGTEVTDLVIPNSVKSIGNSAFYNCSGLTSVTIPNRVTSIGNYAFSGCSGLTSVTVASDNTKYDSRDNCNAIIETSSNTLIAGCKSSVIPNSVTSIGNYAFYYCSGLTSVTIPDGVTTIGNYAFSRCSGLTSVSVGKNIGSIGENAFYGCSNMTTFTCYAVDIPTANSSVFEGIDLTNATLYVPASALEGYELKWPWQFFGTILPLEEEGITTPINMATTNGVDQQRFTVYDMNGRKTTSSQRGILIMKDQNGKTRKVVVK